MDAASSSRSSSVGTKVSIIALTAVLYAAGKGATAYVPSPWGVGSLFIGVFLPAYFAVVSETFPVAIGAAMGTFIGDSLFLATANATTPALSLVAGVPANFVGFYLFGWFVKKYKSWPAFVAATVSFLTLGNALAASLVVLFGATLFGPVAYLVTHFDLASIVVGLTAFWNATSIPAIIIGVPLLIRATRPLFGRSMVLQNFPPWSAAQDTRSRLIPVGVGIVFAALMFLFFLAAPGVTSLFPGITTDFAVIALVTIVLVPLLGTVVGTRLAGKPSATPS